MKEYDAEGYKKIKGDYNESDEQELIMKLHKYPHSIILDVGCGDGVLTKKVQAAFPDNEVVGIDNSSRQIEFAKEHASDVYFDCIDICEYRSERLFDAVYSFYALPHMPKSHLTVALASIRKLLKQSGVFLLYTNVCDFDMSKVSKADQEAFEITFINSWTSEINLTTTKEYRRLFDDMGFKEIDNKKQKDAVSVGNYGDMFSWSFVLG